MSDYYVVWYSPYSRSVLSGPHKTLWAARQAAKERRRAQRSVSRTKGWRIVVQTKDQMDETMRAYVRVTRGSRKRKSRSSRKRKSGRRGTGRR